MSDRLDELGQDTLVVLVTFTEADNIENYRAMNALPFPILVDPSRAMYKKYGLERGSVLRVWGVKAARRYVELIRAQGFSRLQRATEDTLQLGGDFIIGPNGDLIYGYWGEGPADRPSVGALVRVIRESKGDSLL